MTDAERWGVSIKRVEIMNILPPKDIKQAMEKQIKEERERRSHVLQADGERESAIIRSKGNAAKLVLKAEGEKTARIQIAKGIAEAKLLLATAETESVKSIRQALKESGLRATDYLMALQYLNSLNGLNASGKASKVVLVPSNTLDVRQPFELPFDNFHRHLPR
jgi:regulator of protease activity HflC (stomatin/prohibitin superfamily)